MHIHTQQHRCTHKFTHACTHTHLNDIHTQPHRYTHKFTHTCTPYTHIHVQTCTHITVELPSFFKLSTNSCLILIIRSAIPLTSISHSACSWGSLSMVAAILAPWTGGLEYIGRMMILICDRTLCASSSDSQTAVIWPARSPAGWHTREREREWETSARLVLHAAKQSIW